MTARARHPSDERMLPRSAALRFLYAIAALPAMLLTHPSGAAGDAAIDAARLEMRGVLARVVRWGCQYQNIDLRSIADSPLDLIVMDPVVDAATGRGPNEEEMQRLKRK